MKKIILYTLGIFLLSTSCYKEKIEDPSTDFTYYVYDETGQKVYEPDTLYTQSLVVFEAKGDADFVTVFSGEPTSEYDKSVYAENISGIDTLQANYVNNRDKGTALEPDPETGNLIKRYTYTNPGEFNVTVVSTNVANEADDVSTIVDSSKKVIVKDILPYFKGQVELRRITALLYKSVTDNDGNVVITYTVAADKDVSNAKFLFTLNNSLATVTLDGNPITKGKEVDFTKPQTFKITTGSGVSKETTVIVKKEDE